VLLRTTDAGLQVLLLRAYRNWDFPKGLIEPGERPLDAALRETREETGVADLAFDFGEASIDTAPYAGGKVATFYVARMRSGDVRLPVSAELGRPEHHEFRWLGFDAARALLVPRLQRVLDWARDLTEGRGRT
jgi:bis(5'-nucleosidyl)-tetraphosphatase